MKIKKIHEIAKFFSVGVVSTFVHYIVLFITSNMNDAVIASSMGYFAGSIVSYILNYKLTFKSSSSHFRTLFKFYFMACAGFFANMSLMYILINHGFIGLWLAQIMTTIIVFLLNYVISKIWVFN